jgi:transcription-repair coupling factor (superfamily II helicase)
MQLPPLVPGKRFTLPRPTGAGDALLLAQVGRSLADAGRMLVVFSAEPADSARLADELPFFEPALRVAQFPDWETLPYDRFSPHQDLISERLATLWRMHRREVDVVLLPASTALTRIAPPSFLAATTFQFKQKSRLDEAGLKAQLTLAGYQHVSQVVGPGEYAVRGGLIDLYPMGSPVPYRVDLFGDEVDSIRVFDPDSQRSLYPVPEVRLLPGREFPMDEAARTAFRARWREQLEGDPTRCRLYKDIAGGVAGGGIEYYLPLFFDTPGTVFDYLAAGDDAAKGAALVLHGKVDEAIERFWTTTPSGRCCRRQRSSCRPRNSSSARSPSRCCRCAVLRQRRGRARCPTCPWTAAAPTRWGGSNSTWRPRHTACCCWPKATAAARACWTCCASTRSACRRSSRCRNS